MKPLILLAFLFSTTFISAQKKAIELDFIILKKESKSIAQALKKTGMAKISDEKLYPEKDYTMFLVDKTIYITKPTAIDHYKSFLDVLKDPKNPFGKGGLENETIEGPFKTSGCSSNECSDCHFETVGTVKSCTGSCSCTGWVATFNSVSYSSYEVRKVLTTF